MLAKYLAKHQVNFMGMSDEIVGGGLLTPFEAKDLCIKITHDEERSVAERDAVITRILSVTTEGNGATFWAVNPPTLQNAAERAMHVMPLEVARSFADKINEAFRTRGYNTIS